MPLARTQDGYFQTFPRIVADVALAAPFHGAPLVMNALALLVQGLPVWFLLSARSSFWGPLRLRAIVAVVYLILPNSMEWHANTTNTQWVLALLALMVLLAEVPRSWRGRSIDLLILLLCGLTGPFCILLAPVGAVMAWYRRERWRLVQTAVIGACALAQGIAIYATRYTSRVHAPLGASLSLLTRILAARIFSSALIGTFSPLAVISLPVMFL